MVTLKLALLKVWGTDRFLNHMIYERKFKIQLSFVLYWVFRKLMNTLNSSINLLKVHFLCLKRVYNLYEVIQVETSLSD